MIVDSHVHYDLPVTFESLIYTMDRTRTDYINLVALYSRKRASGTIDCLRAKHLGKGRVSVYGSLDLTLYFRKPNKIGKYMKKHVKHLIECGCDGIKMLEGKPSSRNRYPIPDFDLKCWEPYFKYMEEKQIPIIWHVNDPEEFWDPELVPSWAKENGWFYDEKSINNEDQYRQIENVLRKFPNLVVTFAHFYFFSNQLNRLEDLFEKYPNVCIDITPGIELFTNLSINSYKSKLFFEKYQDRIIYGTDISGSGIEGETKFTIKDAVVRSELCKDFISRSKEIYICGGVDPLFGDEDIIIRPLNLTKEIQNKILFENFNKRTNFSNLRKLNIKKILKEIKREKKRIKYLDSIYNYDKEEDLYKYVNELEEYFKKVNN